METPEAQQEEQLEGVRTSLLTEEVMAARNNFMKEFPYAEAGSSSFLVKENSGGNSRAIRYSSVQGRGEPMVHFGYDVDGEQARDLVELLRPFYSEEDQEGLEKQGFREDTSLQLGGQDVRLNFDPSHRRNAPVSHTVEINLTLNPQKIAQQEALIAKMASIIFPTNNEIPDIDQWLQTAMEHDRDSIRQKSEDLRKQRDEELARIEGVRKNSADLSPADFYEPEQEPTVSIPELLEGLPIVEGDTFFGQVGKADSLLISYLGGNVGGAVFRVEIGDSDLAIKIGRGLGNPSITDSLLKHAHVSQQHERIIKGTLLQETTHLVQEELLKAIGALRIGNRLEPEYVVEPKFMISHNGLVIGFATEFINGMPVVSDEYLPDKINDPHLHEVYAKLRAAGVAIDTFFESGNAIIKKGGGVTLIDLDLPNQESLNTSILDYDVSPG